MSLTVSVPTAAVRKGPSVASPVVGEAKRGAVLEVTRDIGAWVKVTWPDAPDGVGYVHASMGTLTNGPTREQRIAEAVASLPPPEQPELAADASVKASVADVALRSTRTICVPPPMHLVGLGGRLSAATPAFGFRGVWSPKRRARSICRGRTHERLGRSCVRRFVRA